MSTHESRGIETSWACCLSAAIRAIMIASDRAPGASPSGVVSRVSDPISRKVTGSPSTPGAVGDAGAGRASSGMPSKTSPSRSTLPAYRSVSHQAPPPRSSSRTSAAAPTTIRARRPRRGARRSGPASPSSRSSGSAGSAGSLAPVRSSVRLIVIAPRALVVGREGTDEEVPEGWFLAPKRGFRRSESHGGGPSVHRPRTCSERSDRPTAGRLLGPVDGATDHHGDGYGNQHPGRQGDQDPVHLTPSGRTVSLS